MDASLKEKLRILAVQGKHKEAIRMLRPLASADDDDASLSLAFMLYHDAFKDHWNDLEKRVGPGANEQIDEALVLLKKIVSRRGRSNDVAKRKISARAFLGQIYSATGDKTSAVKIARNNYKSSPSAFTANRLADIYCRLGMMKRAETWYKKYSILAAQEGIPPYLIATDLALFYFKSGQIDIADMNARIALRQAPAGEEGESVKTLLKQYLK